MRRPEAFAAHPMTFAAAQAEGCYRAACSRVTDGDTIDVLIDLGFYTYVYESIRLAGIDAPEVFRGTVEERALGRASADYLANLILNQPLLLKTDRDRETFGRFAATAWAWRAELPAVRFDVCADMVNAGHAVWSAG